MWKVKDNNRGSALAIVMIIIAFVSLLVVTMFSLSVLNIQMKSVDRGAKKNFYSAEGALEQITLGLQKELSDASAASYTVVMQQYANNTMEVQRRQLFNQNLTDALKTRLENGGTVNTYDQSLLESYLSVEVSSHTVLTSPAWALEKTDDSIVLKDLEITYTDDAGYQSVIETDIRLTAPNLNLIQPSDMPDVFEYSIIANEKLEGSAPGTVEISAGVYAGKDGLNLDNGSVWNFKQANRVIVEGDVTVPKEAVLTTSSDMDLWAKELLVSGGTLTSGGRTYVSNDLVLSDRGSYVTLGGEYYGYGNGQALTEAGVALTAGGDSSAILINGTNSTLDMSDVRRLLLSGSAQIATGKLPYDEELVEDYRPLNDPSLHTKLNNAALSSGLYKMKAVGNGNYVRGEVPYLIAATGDDVAITTESFESLLLLYNSDGTYSLKDVNNTGKYVSVMTEDQGLLKPLSETVGNEEKFRLYVVTENGTNYYVFQSVATGKYVSLDTYYRSNGTAATEVLCANRDKVTDNNQLFLMTCLEIATGGDADKAVLTWTYMNYNATTGLSDVKAVFDCGEWEHPIPAGFGAWLSYSWIRDGEVIESKTYNPAENHVTHMGFFYDRGNLVKEFTNMKKDDIIEYTLYYTDDSVNGNISNFSGTYTHRAGHGNTYETETTTKADGSTETKTHKRYASGVYYIRSMYYEPTVVGAQKTYLMLADKDGNPSADGMVICTKNYHNNMADDWANFVVQRIDNDHVVIRCMAVPDKYIAVQSDGTLKATAPFTTKIEEIDPNAIFAIHAEGGENGYMHLHAPESMKDTAERLYINAREDGELVINPSLPERALVICDKNKTVSVDGKDQKLSEVYRDMDYLRFEWINYADSLIPVVNDELEDEENYNPLSTMVYNDEKSSKATFTTPYWTSSKNGTVTLFYTINGSPLYPEVPMTVTGTQATGLVQNLRGGDRVNYYFTYTYTDSEGNTQTKTTAKYLYIHETVYGDLVIVDGTNENVNLGESIEVKSNQIAYLVPPELIGVNNGETLIGKNPMNAKDFAQLMSYANNTTQYPNFELVSFTKTVKDLGTTLDVYRTPGTDGYRSVFVQTAEGTMVYFYVEFDSDNTSAYFRDYYEKHQEALEKYMQNYVNEIRLSNLFARLTTEGNLLYSANGSSGRIDLKSNEYYGAYLTPTELSGLRNEELGYQKRFKALSSKLLLDYNDLTLTEKNRNLFDNIVRFSEESGDAEAYGFDGISPSTTALTYEKDGHQALVVHNRGLGAYHYASDPNKKVCLILATGDVVVDQDFSGVIIARGTVTVSNPAVNKITGNKEAIYKVLQYMMDPMGGRPAETFIERFFRDGDKYVLDTGDTSVVEDDYITYRDLITYEEWTKR